MLALLLGAALACCAKPAAPVRDAVTPSVHPTPAGSLRDGQLTVHLVASMARWHPAADDGPAVEVPAFGEEGRAPSVPGPLVRVPVGTRVAATFRNDLADTLIVRWMCSSRCGKASQIRVAPGATGQIDGVAAVRGGFVYWAALVDHGVVTAAGGQLRGPIVVDAGAPTNEELIMMTTWQRLIDSTDEAKGERVAFAINGRVWPYTQRLHYTVGDSVRWRLMTLSGDEHPMHLHGFFFKVLSRSDGDTTRDFAPVAQPSEVTETLFPRHSALVVWSPDRSGNWLLHCHKPFHVSPERNTDLLGAGAGAMVHDAASHAMSGMGGLVLGVEVAARPQAQLAGSASGPNERMRLLVHRHDHYYGKEPAYGFVLQHGAEPARDSVVVPAAPLVLHRGTTEEIAVVNQSDAPTAVHWHGIELESFYDGVAGWSGAAGRTAPLIAPGDSFVARFTPPRAGTFIFHTHVDDMRQLAAGLYGALIVLEPGERWNDTTDHVFVVGQAGYDAPGWMVVNGVPAAPPVTWLRGVAHRLRFLSMSLDPGTDVTLERADGTPLQWTPIAKDAAPVPVTESVATSAKLHLNPGETFDFRVALEPGQYFLRFASYTNVLLEIDVP